MNILAGTRHALRFKPGTEATADAPAVVDSFVAHDHDDTVGPTFTIKTLGYFEHLAAHEKDGQAAIVAEYFRIGLVDIDGDKSAAEKFRANPSQRLAPALFNAIHEASAGN